MMSPLTSWFARQRRWTLLAVLSVHAAQMLALAESADATLSGRVVDPNRRPVVRAKVACVAGGRDPDSYVLTGENGEFAFTFPPGRCTLMVTADGFEPASQTVAAVSGRAERRLIVLRLAAVRASITVTDSPSYQVAAIRSGAKTLTPVADVPQTITVVPRELIADQMMLSISDVVRYVPGVTAHQGENNRDQLIIRGNSSSADFFVDGVRDDAQYFRDLYNLERMEALKGPNAVIFGRGGAGGVINRVTKEPDFLSFGEIELQGGSFAHKRAVVDFDRPLGNRLAFRLNGVYEGSDSFRDSVTLKRSGFNPTLKWTAGRLTSLTFRYERFRDQRTADRGITSFQGRPADIPISTFYGYPSGSLAKAHLNLGSVSMEHVAGPVSIRNHAHFAAYDRRYQNYVPGAPTADRTMVALSAYNNAAWRLNAFNQTDLVYTAATGRLHHTLLAGAEAGAQRTDNFRNTGYFQDGATSVLVPFDDPAVGVPATFRQSATDANNHVKVNLGAVYVQDQVELSSKLQATAGLRLDHFDMQYHNNRNGERRRRIDNLLSPRAGLVFKAAASLSLYGSYSVSHLPSSGDQFASLTAITEQMKPEKFTNHELGVKWNAPGGLAVTLAAYRLDRTNTRSLDPSDPARIVQTGSQRTNGLEVSAFGNVARAWQIAGGYAFQNAFVSRATVSARAGAQAAQTPRHSFSLWNRYQILPRLGAGLGIVSRSDMFAAIDNAVVLPHYTRADAAVFFSVTEKVRLQANWENLLNTRYYLNADGNYNISPGSPRILRAGLKARF